MENEFKNVRTTYAARQRVTQQWHSQRVPFKFMLSDKTLFTWKVPLQVKSEGLSGQQLTADKLLPKDVPSPKGSQGFLIRSQPINEKQPTISRLPGYQVYIPNQYQRHYISLEQSFESYSQKFSKKSRNTLKRKVKKFTKHCDGQSKFEQFSQPEQLDEFFELAGKLSAKTYQDRLLGAGLPNTEAFKTEAKIQAKNNKLRAYLLFDGDQPVSYLYCPVHNDSMLFQYLGYDPQYAKLSVGTVLQWLALEQIFNEQQFKVFDFTEGESEHKRFFATHSLTCADIFFLRFGLPNVTLTAAHHSINTFSRLSGQLFERLGVKPLVRKLIRR